MRHHHADTISLELLLYMNQVAASTIAVFERTAPFKASARDEARPGAAGIEVDTAKARVRCGSGGTRMK